MSSRSGNAGFRRRIGRRNVRPPVPYSAWSGTLSNDSVRDGTSGAGRRWTRRVAVVFACVLILAPFAEAVFTVNGLTVSDPLTREVVERYTLARNLQTVRFSGTIRITDWLLDRPDLAATLARHLYPPLERYHVVVRDDGSFDVNDLGALRGNFRLVAHQGTRRVYVCQGQFRSLAYLLSLSGNMVFTLEYREARHDAAPTVEVAPQLYVRLDNLLAHGTLKLISPLLHGVIDRRFANLTAATQIVGERVTLDPEGLYREMQTWSDIRPDQLEDFRHAFLAERGKR